LKILLISDVYFPRVNGVSTSIKTFVMQLQQLGHEVRLIAPEYGQTTEDEAWITRIKSHSIFFDPEDKLMRYRDVLDTLKVLRSENFDLIHIHTPFVAHFAGIKLGELLQIPVIETYHTFFEDYLHHYLPIIPKSVAKWIARRISKKQCNAVSAVIAPSQPMRDTLLDYGVTTPIEVIPTGLQQSSFNPADGLAFRQKYGIDKKQKMALYVGRVAHEKNIGFLLKMWKNLILKMPDALLLIAGEGPAEKSLHHLSEQLGLSKHVKFLGYLDRYQELNACYRSADVFVFASKSETQGLVILEAMAQETPVVAIAELGTKSLLIEGQGALIAEEDVFDFANKVARLLDNREVRNQLGKAGLAYVQNQWTDYAQAVKLVSLYQRLRERPNQ
jgi:1,2-diacylglycerol 3-alpha-glucosyltransferase